MALSSPQLNALIESIMVETNLKRKNYNCIPLILSPMDKPSLKNIIYYCTPADIERYDKTEP
jgi:hypothetical protein